MKFFAALFVLLACTGCDSVEFDRRSEIKDVRVLAIVVDPPVARPGDDVRFEAYVVDGDGRRMRDADEGVRFDWNICLRAETTPGLSSLQYNPATGDQGCGDSMALPLIVEDDGRALLDGAITGMTIEESQLDQGAEALMLPRELLEEVFDRVGLTLFADLRIVQGGEVVQSAYKRFVVTTGDWHSTNPPGPDFRFGDIRVTDQGEFHCEGDAPLVFSPGQELILDPVDLPEDREDPGNWLEPYDVVDIEGNFIQLSEAAYYTWYSTAGRLDQEITKAPADEEVFTVPAAPGTYPLWVFVRDGHLGMNGCRLDFEVR